MRIWGVVLLLVGCGDSDAEEARAAQARWKERGPSSYVYVLSGWEPGFSGPSRIVVKSDVVVEVVNTLSGLARAPASAPTMNEIMQVVVRSATADNEVFEATYSDELGFVQSLTADGSVQAIDDELSIDVSCLGAGTGDSVCPLPTIPPDECPGEATEVAPEEERPLCSNRDAPIGRIADSELVCCPGPRGRTCAQIEERAVMELDGIKACVADDECGTGLLGDCTYAVALGADAGLFVSLLDTAREQECELDFGPACIPYGRPHCDASRCEVR